MFSFFGRQRTLANRQVVERLHAEIVAAARQRGFYLDHGVADTFAGRFELLILHAAPVLKRLNEAEEPGPAVAQDLVDAIFRHLDAGLREMGVGDLAVPKRIKALAEAFLGRSAAYDAAMRNGPEALEAALSRNVFNGAASPAALAEYGLALPESLNRASLDQLLTRPLPFPELPRVEHGVHR